MIVHWLVDGIGELPGTPIVYMKKCDQRIFLKVGDVERAVYDLTYGTGQLFVPIGSNGTLKELKNDGSWTVDWWNGIADVSTKQEYFCKCDQRLFYKVGEVVKARFDLTWPSGEAVPIVTFGTLTAWDMQRNNWDVQWWNDAGEMCVSHVQIQKYHHTEYWVPGDTYKKSCDLTVGINLVPSRNVHSVHESTIPKGSCCKRA